MFDERIQLYDGQFDPNAPNQSLSMLARLVDPRQRVLEVGCSTGYFSAYLTNELHCEVTGIELNPEAAKRAEKHCLRVVVGDIETDALDQVTGPFDVIIFADVLEHLTCPGHVLTRIRSHLAESGCVLFSP
jgi:2-polyprenyl-3-methyl-5-hydroxy-6-metoxy-1,4-benzoquinol methylase